MTHKWTDQMSTEHQTERVVSWAEMRRRSSLSKTTLYRLIDADELARPRNITPRRVGWPAEYVSDWIASRVGGEGVTA